MKIFLLGLCFYNIAFVFLYDKVYPEKSNFSGIVEIISVLEEKENLNKYEVKVKKVNLLSRPQNKINLKVENTKLIIYCRNYRLYPGDIVSINGIFKKANTARNYKGFNYRNYLKTKKIYGIIDVQSLMIIDKKIDFITIVEKIRLKFENKIIELYGNNEYSQFLNGILIGKTNKIDEEIKQNFRDSNISHILAISGLHISYIVLFINIFTNKTIKSKKKKNIFTIIIIILFIFLTGASASCIRSCIMITITLISSIFYRKNNFYISFFCSFVIIILINPFNIYNIGMWLSFFGTFGIVEFYRFLLKLSEMYLKKLKCWRICLKFIKIFLISISAQILIFPIVIYNFNTISLNFYISNFFVSFIIAPILCLGYASLFLSYFKFPFINNILVFFEEKCILLLFKIADVCSKIPGSKIYIVTPSIIILILYYNILFLLMYLFKKRKYYYLKAMLSFNFFKREFINKIKIIKKITIIVIIIISINIINNKFDSNLKINFIDVGQGDCTIIQTPKGNNIIIDGGEGDRENYKYGEKVVFPYLLDKKINKIDFLVISHCDSDHIGGLFYIIDNMKVENIIIGKQFENSDNFQKLLELGKTNKIKINIVEKGDKILIEDNIFLYVLWPDENNIISENILNNNSLVFKLIYKNFSMLFTGDIEEIAEHKIVEVYKRENILDSNILKVSHHRF